jgi:hypothetical protein
MGLCGPTKDSNGGEIDFEVQYINTEGKPDTLDFNKLMNYSEEFFHPFPLLSNRIKTIAKTKSKQNEIVRQAASTRIIIHAKLIPLIQLFLDHKRRDGTNIEKQVYENMNPKKYLDRLIFKRPLVFYTPHDVSILRDRTEPPGADWRKVGTDDEGLITLTEYLSYDEMQISTLIGVSSPTFFINQGDRFNKGFPGLPGSFHEYGIYVGLTGARFEHFHLVESQHVLILEDLNTPENGYGRDGEDSIQRRKLTIWAKLYNQGEDGEYYFPSYEEAVKRENNGDISLFKIVTERAKSPIYFNIPVYKERMRLHIETFFLDANYRAETEVTTAFVHIVGLGLGSWQICDQQSNWLVEVCYEVISQNSLPNISVLNFSWFPAGLTCGGTESGNVLNVNGNQIKILFNKRNVADPYEEEDKGKLLVACYPWDGNAFPGNEYWRGLLIVSGDPAAASCSAIAELQNPYINKALNSNNVFVAKGKGFEVGSSSSSEDGEPKQNDDGVFN